jgi:hypothetical protein
MQARWEDLTVSFGSLGSSLPLCQSEIVINRTIYQNIPLSVMLKCPKVGLSVRIVRGDGIEGLHFLAESKSTLGSFGLNNLPADQYLLGAAM